MALTNFSYGLAGKEPKFDYPNKPFERKEQNEIYSESNEEIAVFEMKKRTKQLQNSGLSESPI